MPSKKTPQARQPVREAAVLGYSEGYMGRRFYPKAQWVESGCILWMGYRNKQGYGVWYLGADCGFNSIRAHRAAWIRRNGPIPIGKMPDHICRNRACINTEHMELVSNRTNVLRGVGPTAINAEKIECSRGHVFTKSSTAILRRKDGTSFRACKICRRIASQKYKSLNRESINEARRKSANL